MNVAILGSRGIPPQYGGFEELAEQLSVRLVQMGHEVTVYSPHHHPYKEKEYKGVRIIHKYDPEPRIGTSGQFLYDLSCVLDLHKRKFDVVLQLGYTSSAIWHRLFPKKAHVTTNMDGLEWKRSKYGKWVKKFLKWSEKTVAKHSHLMVADNPEIEKYLQSLYVGQTVYIPYGAEIPKEFDASILDTYNVAPREFHMILARFVPENNFEIILDGLTQSDCPFPTLIIGNHDTAYGKKLKQKYKDHRLRFLDGIYEKEIINSLRHFARLYFHGHSVGGTNPSLLEAMGCQSLICAHSNPFNQSILGENGFYFLDANDVATTVDHLDPEKDYSGWGRKNTSAVRDIYNWRVIAEQYEIVLKQSILH
jgi:glycosyltransferase involved in cell wall biosynthesis